MRISRILMTAAVGLALVAGSAIVSAQAKTDEDYDKLMKSVGAANGAMRKAADPKAAGWMRDYLWTRAETILAGTSEVQRNILAEQMLGLPKN